MGKSHSFNWVERSKFRSSCLVASRLFNIATELWWKTFSLENFHPKNFCIKHSTEYLLFTQTFLSLERLTDDPRKMENNFFFFCLVHKSRLSPVKNRLSNDNISIANWLYVLFDEYWNGWENYFCKVLFFRVEGKKMKSNERTRRETRGKLEIDKKISLSPALLCGAMENLGKSLRGNVVSSTWLCWIFLAGKRFTLGIISCFSFLYIKFRGNDGAAKGKKTVSEGEFYVPWKLFLCHWIGPSAHRWSIFPWSFVYSIYMIINSDKSRLPSTRFSRGKLISYRLSYDTVKEIPLDGN